MPQYYTIGELAKNFNVPVSTLRFYDKNKIFSPEYRSPETGYRYYSSDQLYLLDAIIFLRELDVPTKEIPKMLEHAKSRTNLLNALVSHRDKIADRIIQLQSILEKLDQISEQFSFITASDGEFAVKRLPDRMIRCRDGSPLPSSGDSRKFAFKTLQLGEAQLPMTIPKLLLSMGAISSLSDFRSSGELKYKYIYNEYPNDSLDGTWEEMLLPSGNYLTMQFGNGENAFLKNYLRFSRYILDSNLETDDLLIEAIVGIGIPPLNINEEQFELQVKLIY